MIYLYLLIYLLMIPFTAIIIVKYKLDPMEDELYDPYNRNGLAGWSCIWPLIWFIYIGCWIAQGVAAGIRAITAPFDDKQ
jgi:hypothetical protein